MKSYIVNYELNGKIYGVVIQAMSDLSAQMQLKAEIPQAEIISVVDFVKRNEVSK